MKKSLGLKICAGVATFSALAFLPSSAYAVNTAINIDGDKLFVSGPNSVESNDAGTATYYGDTKTLILDGYKGGAIETDIDSLTIQVLNDSEITATTNAIKSTGNVTITVNEGKSLKSAGNFDIDGGSFTLTSGALDLGTKDLKVTEGNIKTDGSIKAANITLVDTNKSAQSKITIDDGAAVEVTKAISAKYNYAATDKGIVLGSKICAFPAAEVENVAGTGTSKATTTTFTTSTLTSGITDGIKLSAAACSATEDGVENPDTLDMVYVYAAILVASSAILGYRRYIAKR